MIGIYIYIYVCVCVCLCVCVRARQESSVGIATEYGPDGPRSIPGNGKRFFFTLRRQDRLWGPPSLLSNGYRGLFPRGKAAGA
jgi:hypothetical protein